MYRQADSLAATEKGSSNSHVRVTPYPCFPESFSHVDTSHFKLLPEYSLSPLLMQSQQKNNPLKTPPAPQTRKKPQKAQKRRNSCKAALGKRVQGARLIPQGRSLCCSGFPQAHQDSLPAGHLATGTTAQGVGAAAGTGEG